MLHCTSLIVWIAYLSHIHNAFVSKPASLKVVYKLPNLYASNSDIVTDLSTQTPSQFEPLSSKLLTQVNSLNSLKSTTSTDALLSSPSSSVISQDELVKQVQTLLSDVSNTAQNLLSQVKETIQTATDGNTNNLNFNLDLKSLSKRFDSIKLPEFSLPSSIQQPLLSSSSSTSISSLSSSLQEQLHQLQQVLQQQFSHSPPQLSHLLQSLYQLAEQLASDVRTVPIATVIVFIMVVAGWGQDDSKVGTPYTSGSSTYNVTKSENFYSSRPFYVFRRLLRLARITGIFNFKLLLDWRLGNLEKNEEERAKEALILATQLGPTFIKLGQALSIRTDLIPKAYALELRKLQDAVPPFDSKLAKEIITQEMQTTSLNNIFREITELPIASASIGQVYKGTLKDGTKVAVKVQRPNILDEIALDLYLLRLITPIQTRLTNAVNKVKTNQADIDVALALVDEWGRGFVAEVDYKLEAENTKQFAQAMIGRKLDSVVAPRVIEELSSSRVIVTEWMDGTRLDVDKSPDVPRLCGIAVNAYLAMLLDTGTLHCDPHPGNLLRTLDGRLCILDWGMTLTVPKDLQYALLELIAHVNTEDYDALPQDFVNLGFSPGNKLEQLQSSGIAEGLSFAFRQLGAGGGPSKIRERVKQEFKSRYGENLSDEELRVAAREEMMVKMREQLASEGVDVSGVTDIMETISKRNRELFKLPPYVLYVSRAFSTLEGIGLSINPDYSILQECYPYLSSRLMTDNSPRAKLALKSMLLGKSGQVFSPSKLAEMTENFSSYTVATATQANDDQINQKKTAEIALAKILLNPQGNFIQDIILESTAKTADAVIRGSVNSFIQSTPGQTMKTLIKTPSNIAHTVVDNLVPAQFRSIINPFLVPVTLPYDVIHAVVELLQQEDVDTEVLERMSSLSTLVTGSSSGGSDMSGTGSGTSSSGSTSLAKDTTATTALINNRQLFEVLSKTLTEPDSNLRNILSDTEIRSQLPTSVNNISKKLVVALLNRAADRVDVILDKHNRANSMDSMSGTTSGSSGSSGDREIENLVQRTVLRSTGTFTSTFARRIATALLASTSSSSDTSSITGAEESAAL